MAVTGFIRNALLADQRRPRASPVVVIGCIALVTVRPGKSRVTVTAPIRNIAGPMLVAYRQSTLLAEQRRPRSSPVVVIGRIALITARPGISWIAVTVPIRGITGPVTVARRRSTLLAG